MQPDVSHEITALLRAWSKGDATALETLVPILDRDLRKIAWCYLQTERRDAILDTTALVNETYLRLMGWSKPTWQDRAHFFAVCAKIMRRIVVDHARAQETARRGGGAVQIPLKEMMAVASGPSLDVVEIDRLLRELGKIDERKERVVELRFFAGLSVEETAQVLDVSPETVRRDWRLAKAWMLREIGHVENAP